MRFQYDQAARATITLAGLLCATWANCGETENGTAEGRAGATESESASDDAAVSVDVARDRAKLMHRIYTATLHVMHDRYFHANRSVVPARAMEDVFDELEEQAEIEARWIAVNTAAMSIHHEPRNDFERQAAAAIAAGKPAYERVEKGSYIRASAIPLGDGCVGCHTGFFKDSPSTPRYAGLVIRIPIRESRTAP